MLELASELTRDGVRPKRSLLFAFLTGEETGQLGSKYFVAHPPVDPHSIVADVNVDIVHAIVPLRQAAVIGLEESDLGDAARRAAGSQGIPADAERENHPYPAAFNSNSDQAAFVFAGIPAVKLMVGFPGELAAQLTDYRRKVQHTPSDDPRQPVNFETLAKYEEVLRALVLDVANDPRRPEWKPGSFYKRYVK